MNLSELNKEQKQILILAVGGAFTLIMVVMNLLIGPAKSKAEEFEPKITELRSKVDRGNLVLEKDRENRDTFRELSTDILDVQAQHLPPKDSPYIWALQQISIPARNAGIDPLVSEAPNARYQTNPPSETINPNSVPMWVPYTVKVEIQCNFENLKKFISSLRQNQPYASLGQLLIESNPADPEIHRVYLLVEWPTFRFEEDRQTMQDRTGTEKES